MQTTIDLPNILFERGAAIAATRGATVEELIVEAFSKEVEAYDRSLVSGGEVELPLLRSRRPGTLDLSQFNFDDLLA